MDSEIRWKWNSFPAMEFQTLKALALEPYRGPAREGGMMMNGGEKKNDAAYPGFGGTSLK